MLADHISQFLEIEIRWLQRDIRALVKWENPSETTAGRSVTIVKL